MNNYLFGNNDIQECSSGCESGWTVYLEHSSISAYDQENDTRKGGASAEAKRFKKHLQEDDEEADEDEDLSMVSDASSGPPHLHEEEGYGGNDTNASFYQCPLDNRLSGNGFNNKKKKTEHRRSRKAQDQSFLLDDTASSPFLGFSNKTRSQPSVVKNVLEYSQGYSTTQYEVRQPYQEHYEFFHSGPSGNQMQQKQWLEGKGW